jgi:putative ABC transport system permease protein
VPALAGRTFDDAEKPGGEQSVVINPAAVPGWSFASAQQAVGQRINGTQLRVVGVVPDLRWDTLRDPVRPLMYQLSRDQWLVHAASRRHARRCGAGHRRRLALLPGPSGGAPQCGQLLRPRLRRRCAPAHLLACATLVVLVLAAFGIYVLAAHSVQRRSREIVLRKLHGAAAARLPH